MTPHPVICLACAWIGSRRWQQADDFSLMGRGANREGYGACPQCGGTLKKRPKAITGRDKARARDFQDYGEGR